MREAPAPE